MAELKERYPIGSRWTYDSGASECVVVDNRRKVTTRSTKGYHEGTEHTWGNPDRYLKPYVEPVVLPDWTETVALGPDLGYGNMAGRCWKPSTEEIENAVAVLEVGIRNGEPFIEKVK